MDTNRNKADWDRCVEFHGHECPGLALGFAVAQAGLKWLRAHRSSDEEVVAVVENDACSVDAVQVLTGCTFGKGNLIHLDYGKQVYTFFNRGSGAAIRFALRPNATPVDDRYRELMLRNRDGVVTPEEKRELAERRDGIIQAILTGPVDELFAVSDPAGKLPPKALVQKSEICPVCGEPVMPQKMAEINGRRVCRGCASKEVSE